MDHNIKSTSTINAHIISNIEKKISDTIAQGITPGVALSIVNKEQVLYQNEFGVKRRGDSDPIDPHTVFQLASLSKPLCATLLAICCKKGLCSLDDHPSKYLPQIYSPTFHKDLKLMHLLNHSSGISYDGFEDMIESYVPLKTILDKFSKTPSTQPGEHYEYQNVVFGLIGNIIEVILNEPLEIAFHKYIFDPLKMKDASLGFDNLLFSNNRAYPHMDDNLTSTEHYSHAYYILPGAAGINASSTDLSSFIQLNLGRYPEILNSQQLEILYNPTILVPDHSNSLEDPLELITQVYYGLGWCVTNLNNERLIYHSGWLNGFRNFMGFMPDRNIGVVILANTDNKRVYKLGLDFFCSK